MSKIQNGFLNQISRSDGVVEYWSNGLKDPILHHSITPISQYTIIPSHRGEEIQ